MLQIIQSMKDLHFAELARLYNLSLRQESEFYDYLRNVFFKTPGAMYCIWEEDGEYISAMRLEPYKDGLIIAGLVTAVALCGKGYATKLLHHAMDAVTVSKVYSHIHHQNYPSISVHERCGFRKVSACAVFIDGSASLHYSTYLYEKPLLTD